MGMTEKEKKTAIIDNYMSVIEKALLAYGEDVKIIGSNTLCFSVLDSENEIPLDDLPNLPRNPLSYVRMVVSIPTGSKDENFDGEQLAIDYANKKVEDERKQKEKAIAKAKKIEQDKARRAAIAKKKAEQEGE